MHYFDRKITSVRGSHLTECTEPCPKFKNIMIGSTACEQCKYYDKDQSTNDYVICEILNKLKK